MDNVRTLPNQNTALQKFKKHFTDNPELYLVSATGVVGGLFLARGLGWRRVPKLDKAAIITEWMTEMVNDGYNIYALTNEQKALWESAWKWVAYESARVNLPMADTARILTKEFLAYAPKLQYA